MHNVVYLGVVAYRLRSDQLPYTVINSLVANHAYLQALYNYS